MMTWLERHTIDLPIGDLPFDQVGSFDILDYSTLRVILPSRQRTLDIGVTCFTQRKRKDPHQGEKGYSTWLVKADSLRSERIIAIKNFSEYLYGMHKFGKRSSTIENHFRAFDSFVRWCDTPFPLVFQTINDCREAYYHYTLALNEEVKKSVLHVNSASLKQRKLAIVLRSIFQDTDGIVTAGIKRIRIHKNAAKITVPPSEVTAQKAISLCTHLFTSLSKFIIESRLYPFEMKLPEESVWVFPGQRAFSTKGSLSQRSEWKQGYWGWDYINGRVSDYESIRHRYANSYGALLCIENATQLLSQANQNNRHHARWYLASLAIQCFTMLFIANTAMNITPLSQLCWDDSGENEVRNDTLQGFRTVKYRAGGVDVEFHITNHFLPCFRQYIKLRSWILQGIEAPLFFTLDNQQRPKKIDASLVTKLRIKLKVFELTIPSAREWRSYKSDWLIRTTDVATASLLLQNSEETVLQSYSEGSKSRADREMTDFLQALHLKVVQPKAIPTHDISVGQCRDYNVPENDNSQSLILPDCRQPEGCLFCANYRVHADEEDIRKLCSCLYVIKETRSLAASDAHFNGIFGTVIRRISGLLMTIGKENDALKQDVERIQIEVKENEHLTYYWSEKLRLLVDLGVI
jgi:hypothetical protein